MKAQRRPSQIIKAQLEAFRAVLPESDVKLPENDPAAELQMQVWKEHKAELEEELREALAAEKSAMQPVSMRRQKRQPLIAEPEIAWAAGSAGTRSFPSTNWTQIISVIQTQDSKSAWPALVEFCERYRPAILRFFLRHGAAPDQAEDYTQSFFQTRILERWDRRDSFLHTITQTQHFRSFLVQVLWRFLNDQWKAERSQKAGDGMPQVPLEDLLKAEDAFKLMGREFDRAFALEILRKAAERSRYSNYLLAHLRGELSQKQAAAEMGISEAAFGQAYHRFRGRLAHDLWDEVSKLAGPDEKEIRMEIKYLMGLFAEES